MPVCRMKMRQWLEMMIDSEKISGLVWVDKVQKMFAIPWKHAARHGWEVEKDACLFKAWAIHTGKFIEGQSTADPKTWKANFRCAMNSLNDIEEVKDKSINKGHQAVRVYRMLNVTSKPKHTRSKAKDGKRRTKSPKIKDEEMDYSDAQSPTEAFTQLPEETYSPQENTVDSTEQPEDLPMSPFHVPEWSTSVEIGPDSTSDIYDRFQVSPAHSPEYNTSTEAIIKIAQELEQGCNWLDSSIDVMRFPASDTYADSYCQSESPSSEWSDTSSAQDSDDIVSYANLVSSLPSSDYSQSIHTEAPWSTSSFLQQIFC